MGDVKHTPGPWRYFMGDICADGSDGDDLVIAGIGKSCGARSSVYSPVHNDTVDGMANSDLIAAAPDMLEALKEARKHLEQAKGITGLGFPSTMVLIDAAIAKAEGK